MLLRLGLAEDGFPMRDVAVEEHRPEVVLTGIRMPPCRTDEGIRAAALIRSTHPGGPPRCRRAT